MTRTSREDVEAELEAGRMSGFKIGGKWRVLPDRLRAFMTGETGFNSKDETGSPEDDISEVEWKQRDPFAYKWPDGTQENYELAYEAEVELSSEYYNFIIGYTNREAAGMKDRRRVVVFIGIGRQLIPVVEFAGANDFTETQRLASIIKKPTGRHVPSQHQLPPEYIGMPTVIYSDLVVGPYAASGLAVVANKDDRNTMLRHALIRVCYKEWIQN